MSQENVEVVTRHIEAFLHDATVSLSFLDPYVVFDRSRVGGLDSEVAFGHEALVQTVRRYIGTFDEYRYEVERLTDLGSGGVLAVVTETGRGKGSGVPVRQAFVALYTVLDRKITRVTLFPRNRPSKPWACRSRRCRRRTWGSCAGRLAPVPSGGVRS
jgi:ketosteroid isomerase-like protein